MMKRALTVAIFIVVLSSCGDGVGDRIDAVFVGGRGVVPGSECPAGTTEAFRFEHVLACHGCNANADCGLRQCSVMCGPTCSHDPGAECCPLRSCL